MWVEWLKDENKPEKNEGEEVWRGLGDEEVIRLDLRKMLAWLLRFG